MRKPRLVLSFLLVLATGFASACTVQRTESLDDRLAKSGWTKDKTIDDEQPNVSDVRPAGCRALYQLLGGEDHEPELMAGFSNRSRSLLLVKAWSRRAGTPLPVAMRTDAAACPAMRMRYDSAEVVYTIRVEKASPKMAILQLTAVDDTGESIADMLLAGAVAGSESRLVRLVNGRRLDTRERQALVTAVRYPGSLL